MTESALLDETPTTPTPPTASTTTYVCVPRAVFDQYWPLPWADVVDAAERGLDGLTIQHTMPQWWAGRPSDGAPPIPDVAFLREGKDNWKGRTLLYQQNWLAARQRAYRQRRPTVASERAAGE